MKSRIVPVVLLLVLGTGLLLWLDRRRAHPRPAPIETVGTPVSGGHDSPTAAPTDVSPPHPSPQMVHQVRATTDEGASLPESLQHPAIQRRLRNLICFHTSAAATTDAAADIRHLAVRHSLRPDALLEAYHLAWYNTALRSRVARPGDPFEGAPHAMLDTVLESRARRFAHLHGPVDQEFFNALLEIAPEVPPPNCGPREYRWDPAGVNQWLQPETFPDFNLDTDWIHANRDHFIEAHEARNAEARTDPAFESIEADILRQLLREQDIPAHDHANALRNALDHIHTLQDLDRLRVELTERMLTEFPAPEGHPDHPATASAAAGVWGAFGAQMDAFRELAREIWEVEWGISDPAFTAQLLEMRLETPPQVRQETPPMETIRIRDDPSEAPIPEALEQTLRMLREASALPDPP